MIAIDLAALSKDVSKAPALAKLITSIGYKSDVAITAQKRASQ